MRSRHVLGLAVAALVAACGLDIQGAGDTPGDGADAGPTFDAAPPLTDGQPTFDVTPPLDDGAIDGDLPDAPPPPPTDGSACVPTGGGEVCGDGIDNDCDGHTDCDDSECQNAGWACTTTPPGWTAIAYDATARPPCGPGYKPPIDVVEGVSADPAACGCTCKTAPDKGSCETGTLTVYSNGVLDCLLAAPRSIPNVNGTCQALPQALSTVTGGKASIAPLPYTPPAGGCAATPTKMLPAAKSTQGRACIPTTASSAGCNAGTVCMPKLPLGFTRCIGKTGDVACPLGYGTRHLVGTGISDTRDCTACSCAQTATCSNAKLTLSSDPTCGGPGKTPVAKADGQCDSIDDPNPPSSYDHFVYSADMSEPTCSTSGGAPTGGVTLTGAQTICCQ